MLSQKERDGVMFLIGRYTAILQSDGFRPEQAEYRCGNNHVYWMLEELKKQILEGNPKFDDGKAGRWIGYIQSTMTTTGQIDAVKEADITRPFFGR